MHNKRGQEFGINSAVLVVIVVIVLGLVAAGLFMGWENLTTWIQPDTVSATVLRCNSYCTQGKTAAASFCTTPVRFKASSSKLKTSFSQDAYDYASAGYTSAKENFESKIKSELEKIQVKEDDPQAITTLYDFMVNQGKESITAKKILDLKRENNPDLLSNIFPKPAWNTINDAEELDLAFDSLIRLADLQETQDFVKAAQKLADYNKIKEYQNNLGGMIIKEYTCAALSEHPVWERYFEKCQGDNSICDSAFGVDVPDSVNSLLN